MTEEAAEMYRKSLELDPESASAQFNLASSLARRGEFVAAERRFRAALEDKPSAQAYTGLGFVLWQQGRVDEAIASLHDAIEADPKDATAYDQLGTILVEQGKLEEAASNYRLLVRYGPSAAAHQKLGQVLRRLGRTDEARKEMEMAKALGRNLGEAR
jgi:superkiller protein 3